ncbi:ABC transporter ATP-binding protein [Pseudoclavibacter sp. JSM 162008]|uniref:ABC transporter ATP-binding protein n=1 Tax=Pseudoclavibacter sp. JSM 162008 TaxID=3229855 RepID=UPI003525F789
MIYKNLKIIRPLISGPIRGWVILAVAGSILMAALDTLGVAAILPLMQVLTSGDTSTGVVGWFASALGTQDTQTLVVAMASFVAAAFVLKSSFAIAFRWWLLGRTTRFTAEASAELMNRYVLAPYAKHRIRKIPEIYRNIGASVPQAFNQVALGLLTLLSDILTLLALSIVLFVVSPLATLMAVGVLAFMSLVIQFLTRRGVTKAGEEIMAEDLVAWTSLIPGIDGFREARLSSSSWQFVERFRTAKLAVAHAQRKTTMFAELPKHMLEIAFIVAVIAMTLVLFATGTPEAALATLGVFAAASLRMLPTLNRLTATSAAVRSGAPGLQVLADIVDELDQDGYHEERITKSASYDGDIVLHEVTYRYDDAARPVLNHLNLTVEKGKTTALVGSSGAGKSTILDIVLGLQEPSSGTVTVGGAPIKTNLASWYDHIGVVPQEVFVINATLRANVAYGLRDDLIDDASIMSALKDARLDEFVEDLPEGLDTDLGERGVRLSGGQRQRLGIARALYRRPSYLILDEATSALDNVTESQITQTIESLRGHMTVIIVAHRLSTIKSADKIVFLEAGQVKSSGTFAELRAINSNFEDLVKIGQLS